MILLDTDVCVAILRGVTAIADRQSGMSGSAAICFMTVAELAYGAEKSRNPSESRTLVDRFLLTVPIVESSRSSMRIFGKLKAELESKGSPLADADLLIAAVALDRDLILATGNLRLYARVPGLRVEAWL